MTSEEKRTQTKHIISLALRLCSLAEVIIRSYLEKQDQDMVALFETYSATLTLARLGDKHGLTDQGILMLIQSSDELGALVERNLRAQVHADFKEQDAPTANEEARAAAAQ